MLQCLHLDKPLLEQQSTKKLYGTKNNFMHMQLGQILDQRIQKDKNKQKNPSHFWSAVKCLVVPDSFVTPKDRRLCEMKISPDILINKKWLNHQQFLASKCEWSLPTPRVTPHGDGWGAGGMQEARWRRKQPGPDSWGAYERNEFSEPGGLHLPLQRRLNCLTWHVIYDVQTVCSLLYIAWFSLLSP